MGSKMKILFQKRAVSIFGDWAELLGLLFLIIGFIIAIRSTSAFLSYVIILVIGCMVGRFWYKIKDQFRFPWLIVIFGLLVGYLLGDRYGSNLVIIILFLLGAIVSYYVHENHVITSV